MADNGVKFSEFPSQTPDNADYIVGLHAANTAKFTVANFVAAIRSGLANLLVFSAKTSRAIFVSYWIDLQLYFPYSQMFRICLTTSSRLTFSLTC